MGESGTSAPTSLVHSTGRDERRGKLTYSFGSTVFFLRSLSASHACLAHSFLGFVSSRLGPGSVILAPYLVLLSCPELFGLRPKWDTPIL